ncbi:MAG: arylamine N-acetyltransferase [Casimicrobiaceae bacterium]
MTPNFDLDSYLQRIGWDGDRVADLATLRELLSAHMLAIPFENFDVLLGRRIHLDPASLQHKLVGQRRGGYCFEHATLFAAVLEQFGFAPLQHSARVISVTPRNLAPRSHMFLTVPIGDQRYVVDPGFGGNAPRVPVALADRSDVASDGDTHRMLRDGGSWVLRHAASGSETDCWISTLEIDNAVDFEMANYYTSTHPRSTFVNRLLVSVPTARGRISLMNDEATMREGGHERRWRIADRVALRAFAREYCGFDLPEIEAIVVPSVAAWA